MNGGHNDKNPLITPPSSKELPPTKGDPKEPKSPQGFDLKEKQEQGPKQENSASTDVTDTYDFDCVSKQFEACLSLLDKVCENNDEKITAFNRSFRQLCNTSKLLNQFLLNTPRAEALQLISQQKWAPFDGICGLTYLKSGNEIRCYVKKQALSKVGEYSELTSDLIQNFSSSEHFHQLKHIAERDLKNHTGFHHDKKSPCSYVYAALVKMNDLFYVYVGETKQTIPERWNTSGKSHRGRIKRAFENPANSEQLKYVVMAAAGSENILLFILNDDAGSEKERKTKEKQYLVELFGVDYHKHMNCLNVD